MARRRISVDKIKEVIRYGVTTELSERAIGRALKVSRTAVTKYLECFRGSGLTWEQAQELPDSELLAVLEGSRPARTSARYERLAERFPMMVKELRRKGVTLQLLWEEYLRAHPDGYQNSQFCYHFHRWRKSAEVSMHIDHKAGEKLFVDYAGDRLAIVDPDSGKEQPVETFVAILGASELTYVEASATQQGEDWIRSNERALRYCGGGTQVIVPDNLRSAVSRSDPYEPGINATFDAFAQHYGVVIMPARVRQARDKALVENAVRLTYQRIYAPLRDRAFHSLDELRRGDQAAAGAAQPAALSAAALLTARAVRADRAAHPGAVASAPLPAAADPGSDGGSSSNAASRCNTRSPTRGRTTASGAGSSTSWPSTAKRSRWWKSRPPSGCRRSIVSSGGCTSFRN